MPGKIIKPELAAQSEVTLGSGNVFAGMGLKNAAKLSIKAELAREINDILDERRLTQARAANLLQIHQPQISLLRRGRLGDFSIERLLRCLQHLDVEAKLQLRRKPPSSVAARPQRGARRTRR